MRDSSIQPRTIWMPVGALLGVVFGLFLSNAALWFEFAGMLFLNALTIVVFPLVLLTVIVGLVNLGDYRKLGRISGKTFGLFALSSGAAILIGTTLALLIGPGRGILPLETVPLSNSLMPTSLSSVSGFLTTLLPGNLIEATAGGQYLGLVVISIILGAVLSTLSNKVRGVVTLVRGLQDILHRLVALLLFVAPVGIFFLTAAVVAANRDSLFDATGGVAKLSLVVLLGLVLQLVVVLPLMLAVLARRNPGTYYKNLWPAMLTGLTTGSSVAAYPITYENVIGANDVESRAGSLVLPLSLSLHNCGSALFLAVAAVFTIQAFAIPVTVWLIVKLLVAALIVSLGVSGIPSGALFGLAAVGSFAGFPREALVVFTSLLAIDWLLDRVRTVVNVAGDGVAAGVIAESFEFKTVGRKALRADSTRGRSPRPGFRDRSDNADKSAGRGDRSKDPRRGSTRPDKPSDRKDDRRKRGGDRSPRGTARTEGRPDQQDRRGAPPAAARESRVDDKARPAQTGRSDDASKPDRTDDKTRSDRSRDRRGRDSDRNRRRDQRPPRPERSEASEKPAATPVAPIAPTPAPRPVESKPRSDADTDAPAISPDKIERELSAVRAQLDQPVDRSGEAAERKSQAPERRAPERSETPSTSRPEETEPRRRPAPTPAEPAQPSPPARPQPAEKPTPPPQPAEKAQTASDSGKPTPADGAKDAPKEFGRGKRRKTPLKSAGTESGSEKTTDTKPADPTYPKEAISFGRGKRKKG